MEKATECICGQKAKYLTNNKTSCKDICKFLMAMSKIPSIMQNI